jgi:hypothetical protein
LLPIPSLSDILEGALGEGQDLDFKRELGNFDKSTKLDLVDDAVAFLNASGGNIIVGVAEHKGGLPTLVPMTGDPDKEAMRLQDSLVDNIRERPSELQVDPVMVDGGFLLCVRIGRNTKKPYCNFANGRYLQRRGRKNEPLLPGEVAALREARDRLLAAAKIGDSARQATDVDLAEGVRLTVSILPIEHLNPDFAPFERSRSAFSLKGMAGAHGGYKPFERVADGYSVNNSDESGTIFRFEVGDDWLLRSTIVHPIPYRQGDGCPEFGSMESMIFNHFAEVSDFMGKEGLLGPFAFLGEISHLHSRDWSKLTFPRGDRVSFGRPIILESFDHVELTTRIVGLVRQASRFG